MASKLLAPHPQVARLVERQMNNWELARRQRSRAVRPRRPRVEEFLCISRQVGLETGEITRILEERLGWPVFDREILEAMAGDDAVRRQIYESMDERDMGWWEETLRSLMQGEFVRNDYFKRLSETLLSLACQSSCVFLGRGADLVLPTAVGFRVRLVAPEPERLESAMTVHHLTRREARQWLSRVEAERQRYLQRHFGVGSEDPVRYDMTLNVARWSASEIVEIVLVGRSLRESSR